MIKKYEENAHKMDPKAASDLRKSNARSRI